MTEPTATVTPSPAPSPPATVPPKPKIPWRERWGDQFTSVNFLFPPLAVVILLSLGLIVWFNGCPPPTSTNTRPAKPTTSAPYQRKEVRVDEDTLLWVVWVSRGTKWEASGDPKCFQIDLNAWSKVTLDLVPALVDCTKSTRPNFTGRQRNGRDCLDVSDCLVAWRSDWRPKR